MGKVYCSLSDAAKSGGGRNCDRGGVCDEPVTSKSNQ
jgi:hypothetical protein